SAYGSQRKYWRLEKARRIEPLVQTVLSGTAHARPVWTRLKIEIRARAAAQAMDVVVLRRQRDGKTGLQRQNTVQAPTTSHGLDELVRIRHELPAFAEPLG